MSITETARRLMGANKVFTSAELLEAMKPEDVPGGVAYARQQGGNPLISLGVMLGRAHGVERVGTHQGGGSLWKVQP